MLLLPTTALKVFTEVWAPVMMDMSAKMRSVEANVLGLAIGGQESGYRTRVQANNGPAHSFWQFEEGASASSGVRGVMNHPATHDYARQACAGASVPFDPHLVWLAMATQDELGAQFARLLLWTSAQKLPVLGDVDGAWQYYLNLWRPGAPDRSRWNGAYQAAREAVRES